MDVVDRTLVSITTLAGGNEALTVIVSMNVNEPDEKNFVETMNAERAPIGFTRGVVKPTIDMEVYIPQGADGNRWRALKESGERFLLTWVEEGGQRLQASDCVVDDISTPYTKDGDIRQSVKIKALRIRAR